MEVDVFLTAFQNQWQQQLLVSFIEVWMDGCVATADCLLRCSFICYHTKKRWINNDFLWVFHSHSLKFSLNKERLIKCNISFMSHTKRDGTGADRVKLKVILQFYPSDCVLGGYCLHSETTWASIPGMVQAAIHKCQRVEEWREWTHPAIHN